jgi:DNA-binding transcriptional regulator YhcF (GntR family)
MTGAGRESRRVLDELRRRMDGGTYPPGSFLPSQRDLAMEFEVSRDMVQRVLRELASEGRIESRQGSGSRVVEVRHLPGSTRKGTRSRRGLTLGPLISEAFERPEVTLDVFTLTSETLDLHLLLQAERIRVGVIAPQRIVLRLLLPAETVGLPYPRAEGDADNELLRDRLQSIARRSTGSIREVLRDLSTEGLVPSVEVEIRRTPLVPAFKLYVLNGEEVLHGLYQVIERDLVLYDGREIRALDVIGLGAPLTHHVMDGGPDAPGSVFVTATRSWFESIWSLLHVER